MVWNIQFQVAALVLSLVVAGMCFNQKRLNFASELAFIRLLVGTLISISLDITSIVVINYRDRLPGFVVRESSQHQGRPPDWYRHMGGRTFRAFPCGRSQSRRGWRTYHGL